MIDMLAYEELEAEYNARYDYLREAYKAEARAINESVRIELKMESEEAAVATQDAIEARGGPDYSLINLWDDIPF